MSISDPTEKQKLEAVKKQRHTILFIFGTAQFKFGKIMKNNISKKKDPSPKSVTDTCRLSSG